MPRLLPVLMLLSLAIGFAVGGCKEKGEQSDLELFLAWAEDLEPQARQDTLLALAPALSRSGALANYVLGNFHYQTASDSALTLGWNHASVTAQLDSAETYFNAAVARDSSFVEALVNLGSLWDDRSQLLSVPEVRGDRVDNAEMYYKLALAVSPYDEKARCNLGSLYLRRQQKDRALAEYQAVLGHDPTSALAHYSLAIMFAEAKIFREAITEWELAAKYDPDGDIGQRSRDNIKIVHDLLNAPDPPAIQ